MKFFPNEIGSTQPTVSMGMTLAGIQMACAALLSAVAAFFSHSGGAGLSAVGTMAGALCYASFSEIKTPGSLSMRALILKLSILATCTQSFLAILNYFAFTLTIVLAKPQPLFLGKPPTVPHLLIHYAIAAAVYFLFTWAGLSQGRRIIDTQRQRALIPLPDSKAKPSK